MKTWAALAVICALGVFACGGDDLEEAAATEAAYLEAVSDARQLTVANFKEFETLFGQVWPLPSTMFEALQRAGAGAAFDDATAAIEELEPPPRFEADHAILVARGRELVSLDREIGKAVANQDVIAFALANVAMGQAQRRTALRLSVAVCHALNVSNDGATARECMRLHEGEGGAYGEELFRLMSTIETDVRPLVEFFIPAFAVQERFALLARFKPEIVQGLEQVTAAVRALNPPAEFQRDHGILLAYLDQRLEAARAIPVLPTNTAGGLGPPSGPTDRPPPHCIAREDFSDDFSRLVAVHFGTQGSDCQPPPLG
jgi:hypothetical protein